MTSFKDRREAGKFLATKLEEYMRHPDLIVLALPRGGVPVAFEVAEKLDAPLDVFLVRKIGVPGHKELALGAIASGGVVVFNPEILSSLSLSRSELDSLTRQEEAELKLREKTYRDDRPPPPARDQTVLLIDDGLATGASMRAAVSALRQLNPAKIIVAVPVAPAETCMDLEKEADEVICGITPEPFLSVGSWYDDFTQTTDEEVNRFLELNYERQRKKGQIMYSENGLSL